MITHRSLHYSRPLAVILGFVLYIAAVAAPLPDFSKLKLEMAEKVGHYVEGRNDYMDSDRSPDATVDTLLVQTCALIEQGDYTRAMSNLCSILESDAPYSQRSGAARMAAELSRLIPGGNDDTEAYYLALAAIYEFRGDGLRAETFSTLAQATTDEQLRENAELMALILRSPQHAHKVRALMIENRRNRDFLNGTIAAAGVLLLAVIALAVMLIKRRHRTKSAEVRTDDHTPDIYIHACAEMIDRHEEFLRTARRKLAANRLDDLYELIRSSKSLENHQQLFIEVFDKAFNARHPQFFERVNALFLPDRQVAFNPDKEFTAEMRILAFARIGLTDATLINKLTGLSLNTVYAYRNRLKSRARNRDTFEADLLTL